MNKHPHYATYLYIWGKECIKMMSSVVAKNMSSPLPPVLLNVINTSSISNDFPTLIPLTTPASIKQY